MHPLVEFFYQVFVSVEDTKILNLLYGISTMSKLQILLSAKKCRISAIVRVDFHCHVNFTHVYLTDFTCVNKIQEIVLYEMLALNVKVESG